MLVANTKQAISSELNWLHYNSSSKWSQSFSIVFRFHAAVFQMTQYSFSILFVIFFPLPTNAWTRVITFDDSNDYNHKFQMFVTYKSGDLIVYGANVLGCLLMNRVRLPNLNEIRVWHALDIFQFAICIQYVSLSLFVFICNVNLIWYIAFCCQGNWNNIY